MKTVANHLAEAAGVIPNRTVKNCVRFASTCPKCRQQVLQHGYSRVLLFAYLDVEHEIDAYCAACEEFWPISAAERRAIVGMLRSLG